MDYIGLANSLAAESLSIAGEDRNKAVDLLRSVLILHGCCEPHASKIAADAIRKAVRAARPQ